MVKCQGKNSFKVIIFIYFTYNLKFVLNTFGLRPKSGSRAVKNQNNFDYTIKKN